MLLVRRMQLLPPLSSTVIDIRRGFVRWHFVPENAMQTKRDTCRMSAGNFSVDGSAMALYDQDSIKNCMPLQLLFIRAVDYCVDELQAANSLRHDEVISRTRQN